MDSESLKMQSVLITRIFSFLMFYRAMISCKDPMETLRNGLSAIYLLVASFV